MTAQDVRASDMSNRSMFARWEGRAVARLCRATVVAMLESTDLRGDHDGPRGWWCDRPEQRRVLGQRAEPELMGLRQASWLKRLHLEHDNLRSALDWSMSPAHVAEQPDRALDFATALSWFWVKRGFLTEGRQWLDRALEMAPDSSPSRRARACVALANLTSSRVTSPPRPRQVSWS